jgi:hypothetical protein
MHVLLFGEVIDIEPPFSGQMEQSDLLHDV